MKTKPPTLLLTNDDGIHAEGLIALEAIAFGWSYNTVNFVLDIFRNKVHNIRNMTSPTTGWSSLF